MVVNKCVMYKCIILKQTYKYKNNIHYIGVGSKSYLICKKIGKIEHV